MHYVGEVSETDAVDGATLGIEPDTVVLVRLFRDGGNANDTFPDEVFVSFIDMHYLADRATTPNKSPPFI